MAQSDLRLGQTFIALAGPVGAHKRFVAAALREALNKPQVKFSTYLKKLAAINDEPSPESYQTLQDIGLAVIARKGWSSFCANVLRSEPNYRDVLIIDGLRHVAALTELRNISRPDDVFVVYVDVEHDEQVAHLLADGVERRDINKVLYHPVEAEASTLRPLADYVLRSDAGSGDIAASLLARIADKQDHDKQNVFRWSGLTASILDDIDHSPRRYEALREIVRLVNVGDDAEAMQRWLTTPKDSLERRTPLDVLLRGVPEDAIAAATRFAMI